MIKAYCNSDLIGEDDREYGVEIYIDEEILDHRFYKTKEEAEKVAKEITDKKAKYFWQLEENNVLDEINIVPVSIAYIKGVASDDMKAEMIECNAAMYDSDGGAQYELTCLRDRFNKDTMEYQVLDVLKDEGYDYIEYS